MQGRDVSIGPQLTTTVTFSQSLTFVFLHFLIHKTENVLPHMVVNKINGIINVAYILMGMIFSSIYLFWKRITLAYLASWKQGVIIYRGIRRETSRYMCRVPEVDMVKHQNSKLMADIFYLSSVIIIFINISIIYCHALITNVGYLK